MIDGAHRGPIALEHGSLRIVYSPYQSRIAGPIVTDVQAAVRFRATGGRLWSSVALQFARTDDARGCPFFATDCSIDRCAVTRCQRYVSLMASDGRRAAHVNQRLSAPRWQWRQHRGRRPADRKRSLTSPETHWRHHLWRDTLLDPLAFTVASMAAIEFRAQIA